MAADRVARGGSAHQDPHAMRHERTKLRKVLKRFDLICFTVVAFVSVDTISSLGAYGGGQVLFWMVAAAVLYLLPSGLITAELGSTFPVEGSPYAWTRMAFGRLSGSLTAVFYWMANPTWVGGTLSAAVVATLSSGLMFNRANGFGTVWSIVIGLVVVWSIAGVSIVELRWGKLAGTIGTFVRAAVVIVFLGLVGWFLIRHGKPAGTVTWGSLKPSLTGFLAVFALLQFNFVGFELSNSASEEMRNPERDVPAMIARSGVCIVLIYVALTFGVLLIIPASGLSNVSGFVDAYSAVSGVFGAARGSVGWVMGILIILVTLTAGGVWIQGSARTQAVAGLDGAAPLALGRFSKSGTPIAMNLASGIVASLFVIVVFAFASGGLGTFFAVALSLTVSLTAISYAFIFPAVIVLRKKYPDRARPYRIPGGTIALWACVISTEFVIAVTTLSLLWPGLIDNILGRSYSITDTWGTSRLFFESVTLGSFGVIVLTGLAFYWIGRRNVAKGIVGENDLLALEQPAPAPTPSAAEAPLAQVAGIL